MLAESLEELIQEGELRGELKGEFKNKSQIALNLLKEGSDTEFVSRITGLSKEEILKLNDNLDL